MKKYWFISYTVDVKHKNGNRREFFNEVIDKHPFKWQLEMHKLYREGAPHEQGYKYQAPELYVLLCFQEIMKAEYENGKKIEY